MALFDFSILLFTSLIIAVVLAASYLKLKLSSFFTQTAFNNFISTLPDCLIMFDRKMKILNINNTALKLLGYKKDELFHKSIDCIIDDIDVLFEKSSFPSIIDNNQLNNFSTQIKTKSGQKIPVRITATSIYSPLAIIFIIHDIREEWKLIEEKKILQQELIESDKLAALGKLSAGIAHEINNPLFVISGEAEMLLQSKDEEAKKNARVIFSQTNRIKAIIDNLHGFFRNGSNLEIEPILINQLLEKTIDLLFYQIKMDNVTIKRDYATDIPTFYGSNIQIEQVFINVIRNAIDAIHEHGTITLRTKLKKSASQPQIAIEIEDSGPGIDKNIIGKIFNPFFSTKDSGLGLGLAICQKILENYGGTVEVKSAPSSGSTFIIKLPAGPEP